jgi:hypothetical protein
MMPTCRRPIAIQAGYVSEWSATSAASMGEALRASATNEADEAWALAPLCCVECLAKANPGDTVLVVHLFSFVGLRGSSPLGDIGEDSLKCPTCGTLRVHLIEEQ